MSIGAFFIESHERGMTEPDTMNYALCAGLSRPERAKNDKKGHGPFGRGP